MFICSPLHSTCTAQALVESDVFKTYHGGYKEFQARFILRCRLNVSSDARFYRKGACIIMMTVAALPVVPAKFLTHRVFRTHLATPISRELLLQTVRAAQHHLTSN